MASPVAMRIMGQLGLGMRLFVPYDNSQPKLIEGLKRFGYDRPDIPVSQADADEFLRCGQWVELSKLGDFADGVKLRDGWEELGLPGDAGHIYTLVQ